jgi:hypothetical protein
MKRGLNITEVKTVKSLMCQHLKRRKEYFDNLNLAFELGFQDPKYVRRDIKCFTLFLTMYLGKW